MINKKYEKYEYLQIEGFRFDNNMNHLFTSRRGWDQDNLFEGVEKIFDLPKERIFRAKQVHGNQVLEINDQSNLDVTIEEFDGLLTNKTGLALSTYHADCVPIYYYDKVKKVIGLAHSGWKGTLNNISKTMVEKMISTYACDLKDIYIGIGPSIGPCCYEIKEDLEKEFKGKYPNEDIIFQVDNQLYLDLWKANYINLIKLGIIEDHIFMGDFCTSCNLDILYSYRRERTKNRMLASIVLKD